MRIALLVFLILVLAGCPKPPVTAIPDGFSVSWVSGPTHKERGGHDYLEVAKTKAGHYALHQGTRYHFISKQDGALREQAVTQPSIMLTGGDVLALYQLILDEDILDMDRSYKDPDIMDGDYRTLTIRQGSQEKTITAVNVKPKAMMKVYQHLRALTTTP